MIHLRTTLLLALALSACARTATISTAGTAATTATPTNPVRQPAEWTRSAVVYEVNVRQFTPEGTFRALEAHLPRLDSLGVDILWLMPVQPIGVKNRKGGLGSYYSIADYRRVNPEFGTAADFRALVDAAHRRGMRVILDWVANHTAWDHPWITQHPDWYTKRPDGTISFPRDEQGKETDWTDVADLNFDSQEMRRAMLTDMQFWVDSMNVDGFRCDVAWGVPMDFWIEARRRLSAAKPDLYMLAEAEGPKYHAAFDATYAWELHHLLNDLARDRKPLSALDSLLARQRRDYPLGAYRLSFTSNHDENSWQGTEFERMGANHLSMFVLASTLERTQPLLYTGQEASLSKRLRFFEKDTVDWKGASLAPFYRRMFDLKHQNPAMRNGAAGAPQVKLATTGGERVYAFTRTLGDNTVLVVVNLAAQPARIAYSGLPAGEYYDWFTEAKNPLEASGRLDVPANGYRVLARGFAP